VHKLNQEQELIVRMVRQFVEREVIPCASELERRGEYPDALVEQMRALGLFGINVPAAWGGAEADSTTLAVVFEEISRGWLGLAGILGTHTVLCDVLARFGTQEQKQRFFPRLATGELRGGICLSEPGAGTDLQSITTVAERRNGGYLVNGSKMWITNARRGTTFLLLAKTDPSAKPAHTGMSAFLVEKSDAGPAVGRDIDKLGYKTVETCELHFRDVPVPAENLLGGVEGQGFKHVMAGLESERLNVAARGLGIARAAFEEAIRYAQRRVAFGKPIAQHQAIQLKLANMATRVEASRLLIYSAAEKKDRGERCDLEMGMAKLFASETAAEVAFEAMRILGANGYSKDFPVERYYRDAPLVVIGGGTNELQRLIIARRLLEKYRENV
jgi:alkylation response protein AidB-like acyl-CoA dehydrogenase